MQKIVISQVVAMYTGFSGLLTFGNVEFEKMRMYALRKMMPSTSVNLPASNKKHQTLLDTSSTI